MAKIRHEIYEKGKKDPVKVKYITVPDDVIEKKTIEERINDVEERLSVLEQQAGIVKENAVKEKEE